MSGTATPNLPLSNGVDDVVGNSGGNTVRVALSRLAALLSYLQGPAYKTSAELFADKAWPDGAIGQVYGDTAGQNGTYRKSGAAGTGSWARTGDLAISPLTAAQLAGKADLSAFNDLVAEVRAGRVHGHWSGNISTLTPPAGTDWLLTAAGGSVQFWATSAEGGAGAEFAQDATGQWWRIRGDFRDIATVRTAVRDGLTLPLINIAGTGDAVTADLHHSLVAAGITSLSTIAEVEYVPLATNAAANPTIAIAGVTYGIRGADGEAWPAGGFVVNRVYKLRRRADYMRVVQGAMTTAELAAQGAVARAGIRQSIVYLDAAGGTPDALILSAPESLSSWYLPGAGNAFAFRAIADNTGPVTVTIGDTTRSLRRSDNSLLQAGDLIAGHVYQAYVSGSLAARLFAEITREEITKIYDKIGDMHQAMVSDDDPLDSDAGLLAVDENGGVLLDARDGLRIAGRSDTVQDALRRLEWQGVRAEARPMPVDVMAMYDFTPDTLRAVNAGLAIRGGSGAPIPAGALPTNTPIGKNWLASATVRLLRNHPRIEIDPFFLENQTEQSFVHPFVNYFPQRFMGFEYLMVVNPYPQSTELLENPVLYGSHDMQAWTLLSHIPQPMAWGEDYNPAAANTYLSDPSMAYHPLTRELIVTWRRHLRGVSFDADGDTHRIEAVTTMDGINWSPPVKIHGTNSTLGETTILSPTYIFNPADKLWYCYACRDPQWQVMTKRDLFDPTEEWSQPVDIGINGWHGEARVIGNRVWFFSSTTTQWHTMIYWSDPNDWKSFTRIDSGTGIINAADWAEGNGGGKAWTYKDSYVPHLYPDGTISLKVMFQCKRPANEWWLFKLETPRLPYRD